MARVSRGITIIEVLITISIISLILVLSMPAVQSAREAARLTQCKNNLMQFGIAMSSFVAKENVFPSGRTVEVMGPLSGKSRWAFYNFMSEVLPYLDQVRLSDSYDRNDVFCSPSNAPAIRNTLAVAICPSAPSRGTPENSFVPSLEFPKGYRRNKILAPILGKLDATYSTSYAGGVTDYTVITGIEDGTARDLGYDVPRDDPAGLRGMFPSPFARPEKELVQTITPAILGAGKAVFSVRLKAAEVSDGLSNTLLMTEDAGRPQRWELGRRTKRNEPLNNAWADPQIVVEVSSHDLPSGKCLMQCDNAGGIYSFHPSGVNVVYGDGHVTTLSRDTNARVLLATITPDRGDTN